MSGIIGHRGLLLKPVSGGGPGAHAYWRLLISAVQTGVPSFIGCTELTLHETVGGANVATGYSAVLSSGEVNSANSDDRAFDSNFTDSGWLDYGDSPPRWVGVQFSSPKQILQFGITASYNYSQGTPKDFKLQYSDDGSTWADAASFTNVTGWGAIETRLFSV